MKNIIVIIGHAHYATGLLSALEMIAGKNADISAIDFEGSEDVSEKYKQFLDMHQNYNILFVCDLLGGTPFKEASKLAFTKANVEVVIGCNLGSLLEISLLKDKFSFIDLTLKIVESSKKNTSLFDKNLLKKKMGETDNEL
jgi:PTS system N-acetylgalactosamine-specific IIA component